MRDDEVRRTLREMNPWWGTDHGDRLAWAQHDRTLQRADSLGLDYRPPILTNVVDGGLYVVRGPRRVGKSVALKRFATEVLARPGTSAWQLIYLAADGFDARALRRALRLGRDLTNSVGDAQRVWLIDEVTSVPGWPTVLKADRDNTPFGGDTVVVTGSSAHDLTEARRALGAGRVGDATDPFRLLLPMTFREFATATRRRIPDIAVLSPADLQSSQAADTLSSLQAFVDNLDLAWQAYCEVGGYPRAVAEFARDGQVSTAFATDLIDWLAPDVTPDDPPESVVRLLKALAERSGTPLNQANAAEAAGMTRTRLATRVNRLVATLAAFWCPQVDDDGEAMSRSQSKLYVIDPLLARLPSLVDGAPPPDMSLVSETALALAMARAIEKLHPGRLLEGRSVGYARTGGGREVDFAPIPVRNAGVKSMTLPVESKWVSKGWRREALTVENKYGRGVLATKDIVDLRHPSWALPAGAVALLLG